MCCSLDCILTLTTHTHAHTHRLLVIFAYQQNKKEMSQFCKSKDLAGALTLFFNMYGYKINVRSHNVISVRSGRLISRRSFSSNLPPQLRASWNPPSNRSFLAIEEPVIRPPVDIASHIGDDVWQDVEAEMRRAYLLLHKGGSSGLELLFSKRVDMSQIVSQLCRSTLTNLSSNQDENKNKAEESTLTSLLSPDSKECCFVIVSRGAVASSGGDSVSEDKKDELIVRLAVRRVVIPSLFFFHNNSIHLILSLSLRYRLCPQIPVRAKLT